MPGPSNGSNAVGQLHRAGLRVTAQRVAALEVLARHPHSNAGRIHEEVRARIGAASVQAVYDVLAALTSAGLVRRIEPAGLPALYERRTADNHHHLVCRRCRSIVDADCHLGEPPCLNPPDTLGFAVDEAEVIFWGLCPSCAPRTPAPAQPTVSRRTS
jgi:Fur family ferric uptake transcriptional regulator